MENLEYIGSKKTEHDHLKTISLTRIIIYAVLASLFIKTFLFDLKIIKGNSMFPTLKNGQLVLINKIKYGLYLPLMNSYIVSWKQPSRGEIIVYRNPFDSKFVIKRCLGVPGDKISLQGNKLFINNIFISSVNEKNFSKYSEIPDKMIIAIGDNKSTSFDSRNYGMVDIKNLAGQAVIGREKSK